jgi:transposase
VRIAGELELLPRLVAIPGIGPITATATIAAIGNGAAFKKGRGFAAWLGVVPGEHSTGGKQKLTGTSRRGNKYLRKLFVQGAHTVLLQRTKQSSGLSTWLAHLTSTQAQAGGDSGAGQQDGAHGLGGFVQRRSLSPPSLPQVIAA